MTQELQTHCPHPKCGVPKEYEKFCCRPHWFQLPDDLRKDITRGWKYNRPLWLEARDKAIWFWNERIQAAELKAQAKLDEQRQGVLFP